MGHKWVTIAGFWDLKTGKTAGEKRFLRGKQLAVGSNPGGVAIFPGFAAAAAAIFLHLSANSIPRPIERRTAEKIRKNRDFCIFPLFSILGFRQSCSIINTNLEPFYKELNGR